MTVKFKYIIFITSFALLFSCSQKEDEILNYFKNHKRENLHLIAINQYKIYDIEGRFRVNDSNFQKEYNLSNKFVKFTDSLIKVIDKEKFDICQLTDTLKYYTNLNLSGYSIDSINKNLLDKFLDFKTNLNSDVSLINRNVLKNKILRTQFIFNKILLGPDEKYVKIEAEVAVIPEQKKVKVGEYYKSKIYYTYKNILNKEKIDTITLKIGRDTFRTKEKIYKYEYNKTNKIGKVKLKGGIIEIISSKDHYMFPFEINFEIVK